MDNLNERVQATAKKLEAAAMEKKVFITADGRISEADAAALVGMNAGTLKNNRSMGTAPVYYQKTVKGSSISYRFIDIAKWIENSRVE